VSEYFVFHRFHGRDACPSLSADPASPQRGASHFYVSFCVACFVCHRRNFVTWRFFPENSSGFDPIKISADQQFSHSAWCVFFIGTALVSKPCCSAKALGAVAICVHTNV
jgi:hypothetical protein